MRYIHNQKNISHRATPVKQEKKMVSRGRQSHKVIKKIFLFFVTENQGMRH